MEHCEEEAAQRSGALNSESGLTGVGTGGEEAFQEEQTAAGKRQQVAGLTQLETWDTDRVSMTA